MVAKSEVLPAGVLDALIEELTLRVFWKDTESRYLGCNQPFARDAGVSSPAELVGRLDTELGWKAQAEAYRADDRHVMQTGIARVAFEEPQTTPDGRLIWLRTSKIPLRSPTGEVVGVLGVYEDITERHQLGAKLEERERHLRTLLDALPFMVWLKDDESRFLAVNEPFARAAQAASPDALVGRTDLDVWPRELALAYRADDFTVLRSGEAKLVEEPVMIAGQRTWSETYKAPMRHGARVTGTVGFSRDISERIERQHAAAWALEGTGVQVQVVRAFQEASLPFARRLELALACFEGMQGLRATCNATLVMPGEDQHLHCAVKTGGGLWAHGEPVGRGVRVVARCEQPGTPPHGHYFVSLERGDAHFGTLVLDTEPSPTAHPARLEALHAIGETLLRAIDAERTAQLLLSARVHAEEASQAKSRFLATMSHEIRTPLNGILGMAQLLATGELDGRERAQSVQTILSSGQVLLGLLNDILDLSKVEAGKLNLDAAPFVVPELLSEVRRLFHDVAHGKGLALTATWAGAAGALVGDALRLRQMLSNLVSNAVKFTDRGGVRVEVRERSGGDEVVLEWAVSDDGVGLPADRVGALFQPFSQLDGSATRRYGGTGLGLSIVRHLAEKMGGDVGVESVEGRGSRFWFTTRHPRAKVEQRAHATTDALTAYPARRVLVVEDNPINRLVAERMLRRHGVEVSSVPDGLVAVRVLTRGERPHLVLMDCQMPELDGLEATRRVRAWEAEQQVAPVPVVALTAGAYEEDRALTQAAGMNGFLSKPLDVRALAEVLAQWLK